MAEAAEGKGTSMRAVMVALVVAGVLGGLYGVFSAVEAGFDRMRGQIQTANQETAMQIRGLRDMTKQILEHERQESEARAAAPAPAPAPAAEPAAPAAADAPTPTKAAPAKAPPSE